MKPHNRKLLQDEDAFRTTTLSPKFTCPSEPILKHINGSSSPQTSPNSPFDSSMALTALVLLTALFFMGFFSIYIRRFAEENSSAASGRRRRSGLGSPLPYSSSSLPQWRSASSMKGLDPCTVRSLPLISYGKDAKHPIDCVICLCEFEQGEAVKLIPYCRHVFHPDCIDTWLASHASCPLCRSSRLFGTEEVRLGVSRVDCDHDVSHNNGRSTAENGEAWVEEEGEEREVGPVRLRRTYSCPTLGGRVVLQRSLSF